MQKITLQIEGMACGMCEAHINDAIRKAFAITKVSTSRKRKETMDLSEHAIDKKQLISVIQDIGYTCKQITTESYEPQRKFSIFHSVKK